MTLGQYDPSSSPLDIAASPATLVTHSFCFVLNHLRANCRCLCLWIIMVPSGSPLDCDAAKMSALTSLVSFAFKPSNFWCQFVVLVSWVWPRTIRSPVESRLFYVCLLVENKYQFPIDAFWSLIRKLAVKLSEQNDLLQTVLTRNLPISFEY